MAMRTLSSSSSRVSILRGNADKEGSERGGVSDMSTVYRSVREESWPLSKMITGSVEARAGLHGWCISRVFWVHSKALSSLMQSFLYLVFVERSWMTPLFIPYSRTNVLKIFEWNRSLSQSARGRGIRHWRVSRLPKFCLLYCAYKLDYVGED